MLKKSTAAPPDLDRDGPQPLYEQLKARLVEEFNNAPSSAQHGLSDAALMARFGVSRMTVRNAVAELVRAGLVRRIPGRGTFLVREARLALEFDSLDRFFHEWHMPELDRVTKVLVFRYITPPPQIALALQVSRDAKVLMLRRLRSITGTPATLDVRYVVDWCANKITRADAQHHMLFDTIARRAGVPTTAVEQELGARAATPQEARTLHVPVGTPLLTRKLTFYTSGDRPIITGSGVYRADTFTFRTRVNR